MKFTLIPFRQLQFDAAVALVGFFGGRGVERLEFGENRRRTSRCAGTPRKTRYCTTEMARAADNSQFDLNSGELIGRMSVWPSTRSTQAISLGICLVEIDQRAREFIQLGARALGQQQGLARVSRSTSD